jgi:hypothetical protein
MNLTPCTFNRMTINTIRRETFIKCAWAHLMVRGWES